MKSRFAIVGALAALLLALLYVAPAFAAQGWSRVGVADDELVVAVLDPAYGAKVEYQIGTGAGDVAILGSSYKWDDLLTGKFGTLPTGEAGGIAEYTKVNNVTWVGSASGIPYGSTATGDAPRTLPYSLVYVLVDAGAAATAATVTVTNSTANRAVTANAAVHNTTDTPSAVTVSGGRLNLVEANKDNNWHGYFFVTKSAMELPGGHPSVVANDGDTITVSYGSRVRQLRVDGAGPSISGTSPANGHIQTSTVAMFSGTITDAGSGLAGDVAGEEGSDDDARLGTGDRGGVADGDNDGFTQEPRAMVDGSARDIRILMGNAQNPADDRSGDATEDWESVANGYRFSFTRGGLTTAGGDGAFFWQVTARDRVNNVAETDADGSANTDDAFVVNVDVTTPGMGLAQAGVGYDASKKQDKNDASSIKVSFTDAAGTTVMGNEDSLDPATIDVSDFRVDASRTSTATLAIASVTHPNHGPDDDGAIETRNVVYITLASPLAPDAQPEVNLIGDIRDRAGWAAPPQDLVAKEEIKPSFSLTVTGPLNERPVVKGTTADKAIIRITSMEALTRAPDVSLVRFELNDAGTGVVVDDLVPQTVSAVTGASNTWEVQATSSDSGLFGLWVSGQDSVGNVGETPGPLTKGGAATLTQMTLFEVDNSLGEVSFSLTPATTDGGTSTESSSPFVRIDFAEGMEYNLETATTTDDVSSDSVSFGSPPVSVEVDSHNGVTLTKLTITDSAGVSTDLLGQEGVVDSDSFIIALSGLAIGRYTIHANGTDAAGNSRASDARYDINVTARELFKVNLSPGWNLISLPGDPANPSLDAVLPSSHPATTVLAFAPNDPNGPWLTATRSAGMDWSDNASNTLREIRAGNGYWVETGAFVGLSTLINERSAAAVPPTYSVLEGWNLLGVTDVTLRDTTTEISVGTYLASSPWSVAYTYDTQSNRWTKHSKGTDGTTVKIGQGMWVYMSADGALAP